MCRTGDFSISHAFFPRLLDANRMEATNTEKSSPRKRMKDKKRGDSANIPLKIEDVQHELGTLFNRKLEAGLRLLGSKLPTFFLEKIRGSAQPW